MSNQPAHTKPLLPKRIDDTLSVPDAFPMPYEAGRLRMPNKCGRVSVNEKVWDYGSWAAIAATTPVFPTRDPTLSRLHLLGYP